MVAHILKERYSEGAKPGGMDADGLKALKGLFLSVRRFDMITMANSGVQNLDPPEWKAYKLEDFVVELLPFEEQRVKEEKEKQERLTMEKGNIGTMTGMEKKMKMVERFTYRMGYFLMEQATGWCMKLR